MLNNFDKRRRTLKQLLMCFIAVLLLLLLLGSFFLNISVTREYLQNQLQSHAQDAATSLGLSMSSAIDARDQVAAERMIDVIFDSGDYQKIVFSNLDGLEKIVRSQALKIERVPGWFINVIDLKTPVQTAQVMSGWRQLGVLEIESHPGYAYIELWRMMQTQSTWFGVIAVLGFILAQIFISNVLKPLKRVEHQADQMSQNNFDYQAPIPNTRELARVALAMNNMAAKLGHMFREQLSLIENLRAQSFIDPLTGLSNREGFDNRLKAELESEQKVGQGCLLLLQLNNFSNINQTHGRAVGDEILQSVAEVLSNAVKHRAGSFAARRSGVDFSVFIPTLMNDDIDEFAGTLMSELSALSILKQMLCDDIVHMGLVSVSTDDSCQSVLSKADMALGQAQGKGRSGWQRYANIEAIDALSEAHQANEWLAIFQQVLADQSVQLHTQSVFDVVNKQPIYKQVLARIEVDNNLVVAGLFLPMAERFRLMVPFDQMVLDKTLSFIAQEHDEITYCVTISESTLADERFSAWLDAKLTGLPRVPARLIFEVSEHAVLDQEESLLRLSHLSRKHGFKLSIDRFGSSSVPFSYLQRIGLDIIKLDHSFVRDIQQHQSNQFFLRTAVQIAHSQEIQVIAVGVESEQEWDVLRRLGLDGAMGYYLGRPEANEML